MENIKEIMDEIDQVCRNGASDYILEKVREFVTELGVDFGAIFDALWTHGDESNEIQMMDNLSRGRIR